MQATSMASLTNMESISDLKQKIASKGRISYKTLSTKQVPTMEEKIKDSQRKRALFTGKTDLSKLIPIQRFTLEETGQSEFIGE